MGFAQEQLAFSPCGHPQVWGLVPYTPRRCVRLLKLTQQLHFSFQGCVLMDHAITYYSFLLFSPIVYGKTSSAASQMGLHEEPQQKGTLHWNGNTFQLGFIPLRLNCRACPLLSTLSSGCSWSIHPGAGCCYFRRLPRGMNSRSWSVLVGGEISSPLCPLIAGGCETVIQAGKRTPLEL